jgi:hypothetical protein
MSRARIWIAICFLLISQISFAQDVPDYPEGVVPEPIERDIVNIPEVDIISPDEVPHSEIYNYLATAVANVNSLPDDLTSNNGTSLVPNETGTQLMSYAKWMFSDRSARELLGNTLAPIGINLYILLTLIVFLSIAWATIRIALLIYRFVQYIVREILRLLPFVG